MYTVACPGVFDNVKEERIEEYTSKYQFPTTEMADSLLSSQIERGQMVGRMEQVLTMSTYSSTHLGVVEMMYAIYPGFHPGLFILVPFRSLLFDICLNISPGISKSTFEQFTLGR